MSETILTRHPQGKAGVNILARRYHAVRDAIVAELSSVHDMAYKELAARVYGRLKGTFDGNVPWYVVTVKLDLEARGVIERLDGISPQRLRLKKRLGGPDSEPAAYKRVVKRGRLTTQH
ncbi:MAG: hypothetical protein RBT76_00500 [candidate division Zixibacteria bacterium]|nr:hypothetical protein [candidate division Zixibacteria bacterium]